MMRISRRVYVLPLVSMLSAVSLAAQIAVLNVTTTATQAIVQYTSPVEQACTMQVADMNRATTIASASQSNNQVTAQTAAPHGLPAGAVVYLENSGGWNGWQTISSVPSPSSFVFATSAAGGSAGGNVGVLVDDVNPALFASANQDSRDGNLTNGETGASGQSLTLAGSSRNFVIGKRRAEVALDGNRYSRALQAYSRHHFTLTCGTQSFDQEFRTANIPTGNTHNEGPPVDPNTPGQYGYPTMQWNNAAQTLIDPLSGLRSVRATGPLGTASTVKTFVTAIDLQSAWQNPQAPLANTGGAASFTGPCNSGTCALLLRADNLTISGGATYNVQNSSLDWVKVTINQASISGSCSGDDCKIEVCLTVNGVSCASANQQASLSLTPANFTFGTGNLMDLWQASGPPQISRVDVSSASGTVNYSAATNQVSLASGNVFNIKWTAGSVIYVAGAPYAIASIQNERLLTLANGPASNLSGVPYSANNFGALIWKKTGSPNQVSIGYTTYMYGSSTMPPWSAATINNCSTQVTVAGAPGYNCFLGSELYWVAADGSSIRDLGLVALWYFGPDEWSQGANCGQSGQPSQFDPQNGDIWYCTATPFFQATKPSVVQAHYMGPHTQYTPGKQIPDCTMNGNVQPCILYTLMQPSGTDLAATAPTFNPELNASGYKVGYYLWGGISADGDMNIYTNTLGQDSLGWIFIYTLGDRTPTGTTPNSFHIVASASTFLHAPLSWCTIHFVPVPDAGWAGVYSNDYTYDGAAGTYTMTMTGPALNTNQGAPGGMNLCPNNPLGVTGSVCTDISVSGEPIGEATGTMLQNLQIADVINIDNEYLRVVSIISPTEFIVQRGYTSNPAAHSHSTLTMACGTRNFNGARLGLWNYRNDPYGTNSNYATILDDPQFTGGHNYIGGGVFIAAGGLGGLPNALCPVSYGNDCYQVRLGDLITASQSQQIAVENNPPFAGKIGISDESHPGPCFTSVCLDGRPLLGGSSTAPATLGSAGAPFQQVSGQLWKVSGAQSVINRKYLTTIAYAGRWPLVDVSGASSVIGTGPQDSYKYCYVVAAGECVAGSAPGDVYVNAPYVDYPYCFYPGFATQDDDTLSICIGDVGTYTGDLVQYSVANSDIAGAALRALGPNYAKWNEFDAYWNAFMAPSAGVMGSQVRWYDGVRTDDLMTVLPPFPAPDGVARNTFLPVTLTIHPPRTSPAQSAIVEFGYVENGSAANYYCTSRQETCVATGSSVNTSHPFTFEQSEGYTPAPCATGCTITIPALSGRALYYRWKYLGSTGQVVETSQTHVLLTQ